MKISEELRVKNEKYANAKGITLISLIITIIVMLILIAVTVNVLIESGIIGSAKNAANKTQTAYQNEATLDKITIGGVEYNSIEEYRQQGNSEQPEPEAPCTHTWSEWVETTPATCTAEGVEKSTCTQCGKAETRTVAMAAHTYVDGICSVCGASEPITASTIANATRKSDYYGKYVTGITSNNGIKRWMVFYADSSHIYLTTDGYLNANNYLSDDLVDLFGNSSYSRKPYGRVLWIQKNNKFTGI